jgi:hypothetical protein
MSYADEKILEDTRAFINSLTQPYHLLRGPYGRRFANEMTDIFFDLLKGSTGGYVGKMAEHLKDKLEETIAGQRATYPRQEELKHQIQEWILQKYHEDLLKDRAPHVPKLLEQLREMKIRARDEAIARAEAETKGRIDAEARRDEAVASRVEAEAQLAATEAKLAALKEELRIALAAASHDLTPFASQTFGLLEENSSAVQNKEKRG